MSVSESLFSNVAGLVKLQAWKSCNYMKKRLSNTCFQFSCEYCEMFEKNFFYRTRVEALAATSESSSPRLASKGNLWVEEISSLQAIIQYQAKLSILKLIFIHLMLSYLLFNLDIGLGPAHQSKGRKRNEFCWKSCENDSSFFLF